jgi:hypothetical protein
MRGFLVIPLMFVALVLASCGTSPTPPSPDSGRLLTFDEQGLTFTYPAAWRVFHHKETSSFSTLIADLATVDVPEPCTTRAVAGGTEVACVDRFPLDPNTIVVHITANGFPGFDIVKNRPPNAHPLLLTGRQAFMERRPSDDRAVAADEVVTWSVSRPEAADNFYTIEAFIRGPDVGPLEDQLQQLVASLRFH